MAISVDRIRADVDAVARCTESPGAADRPTFSPAWREARDYVAEQAKRAGCKVRVDAAGNLHARPETIAWDAPIWLSGSHLDSVPRGGNYDGVAGVVAPLEVLRAVHEETANPPPLELIVFAEEEGTTFGLGMLGSRAWAGGLSEQQLRSVRSAQGENYVEAGAPHDVRASQLIEDALNPRHYLGFVEVHIEQGPGMWKHGHPLAVVDAIAGRRQFRCTLTGTANHAGSTSMADRRDALAGAAAIVLQLEAVARDIHVNAVITVGRIECRPNAVNVVPGEVAFTIDFRTRLPERLRYGGEKIAERVRVCATRRELGWNLEETEHQPPVEMDADLCNRLRRAASAAGLADVPTTTSGALHDAAILAPHLPTTMLFIPSRDGISHNPAEFSRIEDVALAARVLRELVMPAT